LQINEDNKSNTSVIEYLDIKGKVGPMNFIYTKLKLEELNKGDVLEVIIDFPAAAKSVPENCERQSLAELIEIQELKEKKKVWLLKLKKL
jgi:tRNA 2-thiouridine synthesizing protein A